MESEGTTNQQQLRIEALSAEKLRLQNNGKLGVDYEISTNDGFEKWVVHLKSEGYKGSGYNEDTLKNYTYPKGEL